MTCICEEKGLQCEATISRMETVQQENRQDMESLENMIQKLTQKKEYQK